MRQALAVEVVEDVQQPEPSLSAMKSMDQTSFGGQSVKQSIRGIDCSDDGTTSSSGFSRFKRLRGLILKFSSSSR